jgi:hypothetical protein
VLELSQIFEIQKDFDTKIGWNRYEKCETLEELLNFFEHFIIVMVDELGEISRVRKKFLRDQSMQRMRAKQNKIPQRGE